jgi:hypothetical protein
MPKLNSISQVSEKPKRKKKVKPDFREGERHKATTHNRVENVMKGVNVRKGLPVWLREKAIKLILQKDPNMEPYKKAQMEDQMRRNGRYGTCADCPDDKGGSFGNYKSNKLMPENCKNTDRSDHWLGYNLFDPVLGVQRDDE